MQKCVDLPTRHRRIDPEEIINGFACFKKVYQRLDGNSSAREARGTVHDLLINSDHASQSVLLFGSHSLETKLRQSGRRGKGGLRTLV